MPTLAFTLTLAGCARVAGPAREERAEIQAADIPADIRKNFVEADTFVDEPLRPWREPMRVRFAPVVKACRTRREAILAIARNASAVCGVKYDTSRRAPNQCVEESLASGKASCTGLSILLAAAYRSVGIPARLAGVGEWGDRPGNHTWVEVWDDDGWHAVEYYPDEKGLDRGWIYDPVAKLNPQNTRSRVLAVDPSGAETFFLPWAPENRTLRAVDRTEVYLKVAGGRETKAAASGEGTLIFEAHDRAGRRIALPFRVIGASGEVFSGKTPGLLNDLNNAPRRNLPASGRHTVVFTTATGEERRTTLTVSPGETRTVVLPAE